VGDNEHAVTVGERSDTSPQARTWVTRTRNATQV
jgi:hypothetical protein